MTCVTFILTLAIFFDITAVCMRFDYSNHTSRDPTRSEFPNNNEYTVFSHHVLQNSDKLPHLKCITPKIYVLNESKEWIFLSNYYNSSPAGLLQSTRGKQGNHL